MRDIIQGIIATEGEAKSVVEKARAEADRILSEAQRKGQEILDHARMEAFAEAEKIVETAVASAEEEKQDRLARASSDIERQIQIDEATKKWAVEEVVRCVCRLT